MNILELRIAEKDKKYRLQLIPSAPSDATLLRTELYVYNELFVKGGSVSLSLLPIR